MGPTTNPQHCCAHSGACGRVVRVGSVRPARSPLQHHLRALLACRCSGGPWRTVHLRSGILWFAIGNSSWGRSSYGHASVPGQIGSRHRNFHYGTKQRPRGRGSRVRRWRATALRQLRLSPRRTLVATSVREHLVDVLPARLHLSTWTLTTGYPNSGSCGLVWRLRWCFNSPGSATVDSSFCRRACTSY